MTITFKSTFLRWCLVLFLAYLPLNNLQAQIDPSNEEELMELLQQTYSDCIGNNTFSNLDDLYTFIAQSNCLPDSLNYWGGGDDDWDNWGNGDSTWTWTEEDEIAWLSEYYADCLGENTFTNLEELYTFIETNCQNNWGDGDSTWTWTEEDEIAWLSEYYADCLGENTFTNLEELYTFIETNCTPDWGGGDDDWEDWGDNDSIWGGGDWEWTVEDELAYLQQIYTDCLTNTPEFESIDAIYDYLEANCETFNQEYEVEVPECLTDMPELTTFQAFINYLANNCGSEFVAGFPACFFEAPEFATDEEYFTWLSENCAPEGEGMGMIEDIQNGYNPVAKLYTSAQEENSALGIEQINVAFTMFPNPAVNQVTINTETPIQAVEVFDLQGKSVYHTIWNSSVTTQTEIPVAGLSRGMYIVKITFNNNSIQTQSLNVN